MSLNFLKWSMSNITRLKVDLYRRARSSSSSRVFSKKWWEKRPVMRSVVAWRKRLAFSMAMEANRTIRVMYWISSSP